MIHQYSNRLESYVGQLPHVTRVAIRQFDEMCKLLGKEKEPQVMRLFEKQYKSVDVAVTTLSAGAFNASTVTWREKRIVLHGSE